MEQDEHGRRGDGLRPSLLSAPRRRRSRRRFLLADVAIVVAVAVAIGVLVLAGPGAVIPRGAIRATVGSAMPARPIPNGFLGLSLELSALEPYAGTDSNRVNPVFEQLVRALSPTPVLRLGGDTTDWTWWPVAGVAQPPGVTFSLTPRWMAVAHAVARSLHARLIVGINLEADSVELASAEARALLSGIGAQYIRAFELGNEPELYGGFPWYRTPGGRKVTGRPRSYGFNAYLRDFAQFPPALPPVPLAAPSVNGQAFTLHLSELLAALPRVGLVTLHHYPLQLCYSQPGDPAYPSIENLLAPAASTGLADRFASSVAVAHRRRLPLRINELNTVSCGADPRVSQTFASALWALDTLFELARVGVDGVNIHTFPGAGYELFRFSAAGARAWVAPEYYGLLLFAQAAPPGSRLLSVRAPAAGSELKLWATHAPDGAIRVVLINKGARARELALALPAHPRRVTLERLTGSGAASASGIELGGRSFGSSTATGILRPRSSALSPVSGRYLVGLPAASAALLVAR